MRRWVTGLVVGAVLVLGAGFLLTPRPITDLVAPPDLPGDIEAWLAARERAAAARYGLVADTEKRIRWQGQPARTEYTVVALHGFSASRQETAPLAGLVADALGANLFETRLAGHGRIDRPLADVRAEDWLGDTAEALAVGARLGEKIVLIGTSTGATLAVAMAGHPAFEPVSHVVLISPNFGPADAAAEHLTGPAGRLVARLVAGPTHSWTPHNERQARYWTTSYPIDAAIEVMRLVDFARARLPLEFEVSLLVFVSPEDRVISPAAAGAALARIDAPHRQVIEMAAVGDPSQHVLAGDILSPESTAFVVDAIVAFVTGMPAGAR